MSIPILISNVLIALISAGGFWVLIDHTIEAKRKTKEEKLDKLIADVDDIKKELEASTELSKAFSRERLNRLSEKYMKLGYIPKEDIISYKLLGKAYKNADGNTEVKTKFEYVIENLEVKW